MLAGMSGCRPHIAFLPLLLLMEEQGGGQGTAAASAAADRRSWRRRKERIARLGRRTVARRTDATPQKPSKSWTCC